MSKSKSAAAVDQGRPLPQCAGPKLQPFPNRQRPLKFIRLLSEDDTGEHSHVFEVTIGSNSYALKMFKFYDPEEDSFGITQRHAHKVTEETVINHMDPFYAECRAFGRIQEQGLNGKVAVECYGFIGIPASYEDELAKRFGVDDWDRPEEEYLKKSAQKQPFRAIVKELIHGRTGITSKVVRKMARDLRRLRRIGVYPMDIKAPNYMSGRLIDFSISHTEPHYLYEIRPAWMVEILKGQDLVKFEDMIADEKINTWVRMERNEEYCEKLRNPGKRRDS